MNLPFLVFPYQRPPLWYTPLSVFTQTMPLDFAAAICESEAEAVDVLDAFFVAPPAEGELAVELAAGGLPAGVEFDIGAAALVFAPDDLLLLAAGFELSAAAVAESATVDFSALFFLLLFVPVVLALADSLEASPEAEAVVSDFLLFLLFFVSVVLLLAGSLAVSPDAVLVSDFLLFLLLLFEELLSALSELAELSDADESDSFAFELFFVGEVESDVLLVALSELAFFLDFLLLVEVVLWSADVPDCVSWDWARAAGTDNMNNRHVPPAQAVNLRKREPFIDMKPPFRCAAGQTNGECCVPLRARPKSELQLCATQPEIILSHIPLVNCQKNLPEAAPVPLRRIQPLARGG